MKLSIKWFLLVSLLGVCDVRAADGFAQVNEWVKAGKTDKAIEFLEKRKQSDSGEEEKSLIYFKLGQMYFDKSDWNLASENFNRVLAGKSTLEEYTHYYLGQIAVATNKLDEAEKSFRKILSLSPNVKLTIDASMALGKIHLQSKNFKQARDHFYKLERRTRNTEEYPEVIYHLALAEKGLKKHSYVCKWLRKLYTRHPQYKTIADWNVDLAANEFDGKPSDCSATVADFKVRLRHMLFAGLDQKAQLEVNVMKEKFSKVDKFQGDQLQAQFYLQEGEVAKALEILKPYYEQKKREVNFLISFASAAARGGDVQLAVGSYYQAYKMSGRKSKVARQSLYQAAFMSYQFQDYDGAARRFQEFIKVYPSSGLARDAEWNLAWVKYLKGDFEGSYKDFQRISNLKKRKVRGWRTYPQDRLSYWMAMSLYRQGKFAPAKNLFQELAKDPLMGYYSVAAQQRLKKFPSPMLKGNTAPATLAADEGVQISVPSPVLSRFSLGDVLMPSTINDVLEGSAEAEESEDSLSVAQLMEESEEQENSETGSEDGEDETEAETADNPDVKSVEVANNVPFSQPAMVKRFQRARDLMILGQEEWARWDLYDIERKTSNRDYLQTLINEYNSVGYYHRSSYIGQIYFGAQRAKHGISGVRFLWEATYPRAYATHVEAYTKKFDVPQELVWGIMRAESNYRRDAISPVGALGLMQVMPYTGHRVATMIGERNFVTRQLLEPEVAIKIGSRYLKRLMDKFENLIPLVAAGYNAGPHRVKTWMTSFGNLETDEFIEHIPFLETRNYVKRVVGNAYIYGQLYQTNTNLFPYLAEALPIKEKHGIVTKESWDDI